MMYVQMIAVYSEITRCKPAALYLERISHAKVIFPVPSLL